MIGNNTLSLNQAEIIRAIEYYLNAVQFKEPVKVTKVSEDRNGYTFLVTVEDADPEELEITAG